MKDWKIVKISLAFLLLVLTFAIFLTTLHINSILSDVRKVSSQVTIDDVRQVLDIAEEYSKNK